MFKKVRCLTTDLACEPYLPGAAGSEVHGVMSEESTD